MVEGGLEPVTMRENTKALFKNSSSQTIGPSFSYLPPLSLSKTIFRAPCWKTWLIRWIKTKFLDPTRNEKRNRRSFRIRPNFGPSPISIQLFLETRTKTPRRTPKCPPLETSDRCIVPKSQKCESWKWARIWSACQRNGMN